MKSLFESIKDALLHIFLFRLLIAGDQLLGTIIEESVAMHLSIVVGLAYSIISQAINILNDPSTFQKKESTHGNQ